MKENFSLHNYLSWGTTFGLILMANNGSFAIFATIGLFQYILTSWSQNYLILFKMALQIASFVGCKQICHMWLSEKLRVSSVVSSNHVFLFLNLVNTKYVINKLFLKTSLETENSFYTFNKGNMKNISYFLYFQC